MKTCFKFSTFKKQYFYSELPLFPFTLFPVRYLSERRPDDLDRSDSTFSSIDLLELFSLSSLTDWINVSICLASGVSIAFILLSTSLDHNFHASGWDCRLFSPSLADSTKACASSISTNYRVGVLFSSDTIGFLIGGNKSSV